MTTETCKGIVLFTITDRGALYSAYMPFLISGGVFVPTARAYEIGDEVFVLLQMMDETSMYAVKANVVWVTSAGAQGNKSPGIGVQFSEDDNGKTKSKIEAILGEALQGERETHTM